MRHTASESRIIAIIPAAGSGTRAKHPDDDGLPKQYRLLSGVPMVRRAVQALLADDRIAQVRVAVSPEDQFADEVLCGLSRTVVRPCGGPTRQETVMQALQDAQLRPGDWVLVHDAARPGLPANALGRLLDTCLAANQGGLLAMPVADTVKQADLGTDGTPLVRATVPRDTLWLAQTPQMFKADELLQALIHSRHSGSMMTDEASAMEACGHRPLLVQGSWRNAKVTLPDDFSWVESWL